MFSEVIAKSLPASCRAIHFVPDAHLADKSFLAISFDETTFAHFSVSHADDFDPKWLRYHHLEEFIVTTLEEKNKMMTTMTMLTMTILIICAEASCCDCL